MWMKDESETNPRIRHPARRPSALESEEKTRKTCRDLRLKISPEENVSFLESIQCLSLRTEQSKQIKHAMDANISIEINFPPLGVRVKATIMHSRERRIVSSQSIHQTGCGAISSIFLSLTAKKMIFFVSMHISFSRSARLWMCSEDRRRDDEYVYQVGRMLKMKGKSEATPRPTWETRLKGAEREREKSGNWYIVGAQYRRMQCEYTKTCKSL